MKPRSNDTKTDSVQPETADAQQRKNRKPIGGRKKPMTPFERFQGVVLSMQTLLLLVTSVAAIMIGFEQNRISEHLLDLNYVPSVAIVYVEGQMRILNKGNQNIQLWGTKLGDEPPAIGKLGRFITPGGSYYIFTDQLSRHVEKTVGRDSELRLSFEVYIKTGNGQKHTVKNLLWCVLEEENLEVHTQTLDIVRGGW